MMFIIKWTIIFLLVFIATIACSILAGWIRFKHFRKCPYCHKRMKYQYNRTDKEGYVEAYIFHCPHCGAFENVTPLQMIREEHDTK